MESPAISSPDSLFTCRSERERCESHGVFALWHSHFFSVVLQRLIHVRHLKKILRSRERKKKAGKYNFAQCTLYNHRKPDRPMAMRRERDFSAREIEQQSFIRRMWEEKVVGDVEVHTGTKTPTFRAGLGGGLASKWNVEPTKNIANS